MIMDVESLKLLEDAGAQGRFHQPASAIPCRGWCRLHWRKAPSEVKLYGRDTSNMIHLGQGNVYYSTSGYAVQIYDSTTGNRHAITQKTWRGSPAWQMAWTRWIFMLCWALPPTPLRRPTIATSSPLR